MRTREPAKQNRGTLIRGPLAGHMLNIPRTDPKTGKKSVITVGKEG